MKLQITILLITMTLPLFATTYYVSPKGQDKNPGTIDAPFLTIQKAANLMQPGDTCILRGGTYRETVKLVARGGSKEQPIVFSAYPGEVPILSGTELVMDRWEQFKENIYRTRLKTNLDIQQVFLNDSLMTWARWPNTTFKERWSNDKWKAASQESTLGVLKDPALAETNIDWTGAVVTLNTNPNWNKWTAIVRDHGKGKDHFYYTKALQWKNFTGASAGQGAYFLSGKLEALDAPEEWFYDVESGFLYLFAPGGNNPESYVVETKQRNYGFYFELCDFIRLEGIHFFGCTFNFRECDYCIVDECHIRYPNAARTLDELNIPSKPTICTQIIGHHNTVVNSSLAYSPTFGLRMLGSYNVVENNLIYDVNWIGSLVYANVWMGSLEDNYTWEGGLKYEGMLNETVNQDTPEELKNVQWGGSNGNIVKAHDPDKALPAGNCTVRHNTLFGSGNIVLGFFEQPDYDISYNHVYDGGHFVHDVSMIYTTLPQIRGSVIHHNWVHTKYKLCIRADDQSRGVTVHHNVMWGSHTGNLVVKGEDNAVYHNTSLRPENDKNWGLNIQVWPEPDKPHYRKLWPLLPEQNANTPVWNNFSHKITDHHLGRLYPADDPRLSHNLIVNNPDSLLVNPAKMDFRPKKDSPLIDAAKPIHGVNDNYKGDAPDIGAYEYGDKYWIPGYKNFVNTFGLEIDQQSNKATIKVALGLPPLKSTYVKIKAQTESAELMDSAILKFTPDNWNIPQEVNFLALKRVDAKDYFIFDIEANISVPE